MTTIITLITGKFLPYLIGAGGLLLAFFGYGWKKKREGRQAEIAKQKAVAAKNVAIAKEESDVTERRTDAEVRARLKGRRKR